MLLSALGSGVAGLRVGNEPLPPSRAILVAVGSAEMVVHFGAGAAKEGAAFALCVAVLNDSANEEYKKSSA